MGGGIFVCVTKSITRNTLIIESKVLFVTLYLLLSSYKNTHTHIYIYISPCYVRSYRVTFHGKTCEIENWPVLGPRIEVLRLWL